MDAIASGFVILAIVLIAGCCGIGLFAGFRSRKKQRNIHNFGEGEKNITNGKTIGLKISGMTCQGCADIIGRYLERERGVEQVSIDWKTGNCQLAFDPEVTSEEKILHNRAFAGHYSAELVE